MSIDDLIRALELMKAQSPLGGKTCVYWLIPGQDEEPVNYTLLSTDEASAVAYLYAKDT